LLNALAGIEALSQFFELKQIVYGVKQLIAPIMTPKSLVLRQLLTRITTQNKIPPELPDGVLRAAVESMIGAVFWRASDGDAVASGMAGAIGPAADSAIC